MSTLWRLLVIERSLPGATLLPGNYLHYQMTLMLVHLPNTHTKGITKKKHIQILLFIFGRNIIKPLIKSQQFDGNSTQIYFMTSSMNL